RRHTRFSRDWSSDVCSSDLSSIGKLNAGTYQLIYHLKTNDAVPSTTHMDTITFTVQQPTGLMEETKSLESVFVYPNPVADMLTRSEERRVGKGCIFRQAR